MTLDHVLTFVLLLALVIWMGGAIVGTLIGSQLQKAEGGQALGTFCTAFATVAGPVFGLSSMVVLGTGLGLVLQDGAPAFTDGWVLAAFACWLVGMLFGATLVGMTWTRAGKQLADGESMEAVAPIVARARMYTWLDVAILAAGLLVVVWRPGA